MKGGLCVIPVEAGIPPPLDRRNPPHPARLNGWMASPTGGKAGCFIRLKCYVFNYMGCIYLAQLPQSVVFEMIPSPSNW